MSQTVSDDDFTLQVAELIDRRGLLPRGGAVVAAVSGGADSVAMLTVLHALAGAGRGYRITVAHLDHMLRSDSPQDADFVRNLARQMGLPCQIERRDVGALARQTGQGTEQAARMVRYEFLAQTARSAGASHVAVGHHADDNVETVLYRIIRGTGLTGLAGIPLARPLQPAIEGKPTNENADSTDAPLTLIRPLLNCRRDEIESFCRRAGLTWRTDSTNIQTAYRRNFIRHELLGTLRAELNPRVDEAVLRLAAAADSARDFVDSCARKALAAAMAGPQSPGRMTLSRPSLAGQHPAVGTAAMRLALEQLGVPMRQVGAERLAELAGMIATGSPASICLDRGWQVRVAGEELVIEKSPTASIPGGQLAEADDWVVTLNCPGETVFPGGRITCGVENYDQTVLAEHCRNHAAGEELLDADQLRGKLICRPRKQGDSFIPLGSPGRQTVSDFLTNTKLPAPRRRQVLCICDELSLVYLAPLRIDARVKVMPATRRVLRLKVKMDGW